MRVLSGHKVDAVGVAFLTFPGGIIAWCQSLWFKLRLQFNERALPVQNYWKSRENPFGLTKGMKGQKFLPVKRSTGFSLWETPVERLEAPRVYSGVSHSSFWRAANASVKSPIESRVTWVLTLATSKNPMTMLETDMPTATAFKTRLSRSKL